MTNQKELGYDEVKDKKQLNNKAVRRSLKLLKGRIQTRDKAGGKYISRNIIDYE